MNTSAMTVTTTAAGASTPRNVSVLRENATDAVDADVMPDVMTVKQTRNDRTWTPNARCV